MHTADCRYIQSCIDTCTSAVTQKASGQNPDTKIYSALRRAGQNLRILLVTSPSPLTVLSASHMASVHSATTSSDTYTATGFTNADRCHAFGTRPPRATFVRGSRGLDPRPNSYGARGTAGDADLVDKMPWVAPSAFPDRQPGPRFEKLASEMLENSRRILSCTQVYGLEDNRGSPPQIKSTGIVVRAQSYRQSCLLDSSD
jgi:hypothetical protein